MLFKSPVETKNFQSMMEDIPVNVMTCDLRDFRINYLNQTSIETLRKIEHLLPCRADDMLGQSIDIFHKAPEHQRRILADPRNLPFATHIRLGEETLDLLVTAIYDKNGKYLMPMLTWSVITEKVQAEEDAARQMQMIDQMPVNVMFLDIEDFTITFMNQTSLETLQPLEHLLPCKAEEIVGQSVDIFHKHPEHQRAMLRDPNNLPHRAKIKLGDETLDLRVSAVTNQRGDYIGAMLTWNVISKQERLADDFESNIKGVVQSVASASTEMQSTAQSMASTAEETNIQASTVAAASEQLTSSITEISSQVVRSAEIAMQAVEEAERSNQQVRGLAEAARQIGKVVSLINDIASQTNLLALNATIEAARAGEAGKGFAVVANEVKGLANQTGKATEEIAAQVSAIQGATDGAVAAIESISRTINEISEIQTSISSAVEEQSAATQEVTSNISGVTQASSETGHAATEVLGASRELSQQSEHLGLQVDNFLIEIREEGGKRSPSINEEQKRLVQASFAKLEPTANQVAEMFYDRLFALDPTVEPLFNGDMHTQARKLMTMIKTAVNGLDRLDTIIPAVEELGRRHETYRVEDSHYNTVGTALMWTLEQNLRQDFTPDVKAAWNAVYSILATSMRNAAKNQ